MLPKHRSRHRLGIERAPARHSLEIEMRPDVENQLGLAAEVQMPGLQGVARVPRAARVESPVRGLHEEAEMHHAPGLSEQVEVHRVLGLTVGGGLEGESHRHCAQDQRPPCVKHLVADGIESESEVETESGKPTPEEVTHLVWMKSRRRGRRLAVRRHQTFPLWPQRRHLSPDGRCYFL